MAIEKIDVSTEKFDGFARVLIFPGVDPDTFTNDTTLASVLTGGKDLGQIVDESYSWEGDEASVDTLKDTEGGVIRALPTPGTLAWACRLPSTSAKMSKTIAGATTYKAESETNGDVTIDTTKDIVVLNPSNMTMTCPIGVLDRTHKKLWLYPKATVTTSMGLDDAMLEYTLSATAETIETKYLGPMMIIPLKSDPLANATTATEEV